MSSHHLNVKGHTLLDQRAYQQRGGKWVQVPSSRGCAVCSCGAHSEPLPSNEDRKTWARQHKWDVLCEALEDSP